MSTTQRPTTGPTLLDDGTRSEPAATTPEAGVFIYAMVLLFVALLTIPSTLASALALGILWGLYAPLISPALPELSWLGAVGICLIANVLTFRPRALDMGKKATWRQIGQSIWFSLLHAATMIVLGYLLYWFY